MTKSRFEKKLFTFIERQELEKLLEEGLSQRAAAFILLRGKSTIDREVNRCVGQYCAIEAQRHAEETHATKTENARSERKKMRDRLDTLERMVCDICKKKIENKQELYEMDYHI